MSALVPSAAQGPDEAARAARAEWRSRQLLDAAARLMERDGFQSVSMQALAEEASVSVGLIYRYFGGKDEILLAVITNVLTAFAHDVPAAVEKADSDPVERIAAAFRAYCEVIDRHRHAAVLTYRESKALSHDGRETIKRLEVETTDPLRVAILDAIEAGLLVPVDAELVSYNLLLLAHSWALKHWYFERSCTFEEYVAKQTALALSAVVHPDHRERYRRLLAPMS